MGSDPWIRGDQMHNPYLTDETSIPAVISAMSLEEKARLVVGSLACGTVPGAVGASQGISHLGVPSLDLADGPAGVRLSTHFDNPHQECHATAFPIASMLASTWNLELVEELGTCFGNEVLNFGIDFILGPGMNIQRNPLNGRNFEYFSEDPLVSGKMAAAIVKGIQSQGVGATLKHFAANNQETNRTTVDAVISQRALREIYLKGFAIAVKEASPWAIMTSYNALNGVHTSQNPELIMTILRDEWDYQGVVMTDWDSENDPIAAIIAGNDWIMPGHDHQVQAVIQAVREGRLSEAVLDRNIAHILQVLLKTPKFRGVKPTNKFDTQAHAAIARKAAVEGMVLLTNNGCLPLSKNQHLAVFGIAQVETIKGGKGSGDVHPRYVISIADGLQQAGYTLDQTLLTSYKDYVQTLRQLPEYQAENWFWGLPPLPEKPLTREEVIQSSSADAAIIVIGRNSGEARDRTLTPGDFYLSNTEKAMINLVSEIFHDQNKPVIVILNIGGPTDMSGWQNRVDAILLAWQPGQEAGHAVADILSGAANPSGKLAVTFAKTYTDYASANNFPGTPSDNPTQVIYAEDIYVGYRYSETFNVEPAYAFGHGLSYTKFTYSQAQLVADPTKQTYTISVQVQNTGNVAGKEVVQIYCSKPAGRIGKPALELCAFAKTKELKPGEIQELTFVLTPADLATFDETNNAWILEPGTYQLHVAASVKDIKATLKFSLDQEQIVERVNPVLAPPISFDRLYNK